MWTSVSTNMNLLGARLPRRREARQAGVAVADVRRHTVRRGGGG
jgi:hypothetical protein